jgi:hypothetical protein
MLNVRVGMKIGIHVPLTGKRAIADVVYVDPEQPRHCGINLEKPENIRTSGGCRRRRMIGKRVTLNPLHSILNESQRLQVGRSLEIKLWTRPLKRL